MSPNEEQLEKFQKVVPERATPQEGGRAETAENRRKVLGSSIIEIARKRGLLGANEMWSKALSASGAKYWEEALLEEGILNDNVDARFDVTGQVQDALEALRMDAETEEGEDHKAA